jgi:hypothetical protein
MPLGGLLPYDDEDQQLGTSPINPNTLAILAALLRPQGGTGLPGITPVPSHNPKNPHDTRRDVNTTFESRDAARRARLGAARKSTDKKPAAPAASRPDPKRLSNLGATSPMQGAAQASASGGLLNRESQPPAAQPPQSQISGMLEQRLRATFPTFTGNMWEGLKNSIDPETIVALGTMMGRMPFAAGLGLGETGATLEGRKRQQGLLPPSPGAPPASPASSPASRPFIGPPYDPSKVKAAQATPTRPLVSSGRRQAPAAPDTSAPIGPGDISSLDSALGAQFAPPPSAPSLMTEDPEEPLGDKRPGPPPPPTFGQQVFRALIEGIPQAIVNYASAKYDRPDIAEDFLKRRALAIEDSLNKAKLEAERQNDAFTREVQLFNLNMSRGTARRSIIENATQAQQKVIDGKMTPEIFGGQMQALASEMYALGEDPEEFLASHPYPKWAALSTMREKAIKALEMYTTDPTKRSEALDLANIENLLVQNGKNFTVAQVLRMTGDINADGTYPFPWSRVNASQFKEVTTRDANGRSVTTLLPIGQVINKKQVQERAPETREFRPLGVERDEAAGETVYTGLIPGSLTPVQIRVPAPLGGFTADMVGFKNFQDDMDRHEVARRLWIFENPNSAPPSGTVLSEYLRNPQNQERIQQGVKRLRGGG